MRGRFGAFGYREVMTPVLEFAEVIDRAQEGGLREAFRLFDDAGRVLVLRPDLTIPVARLVATRMADHPGPVRVSYLARAFRPPPPGAPAAVRAAAGGHRAGGRRRPGGRRRGAGAAGGEPARRRASAGCRVGVGDVSLTAAVLDGVGIEAGARAALGAALAARNFVEWRRLARAAVPDGPAGALVAELPGLRGGRRAAGADRPATVPAAAGGLRAPCGTCWGCWRDHGVGRRRC